MIRVRVGEACEWWSCYDRPEVKSRRQALAYGKAQLEIYNQRRFESTGSRFSEETCVGLQMEECTEVPHTWGTMSEGKSPGGRRFYRVQCQVCGAKGRLFDGDESATLMGEWRKSEHRYCIDVGDDDDEEIEELDL